MHEVYKLQDIIIELASLRVVAILDYRSHIKSTSMGSGHHPQNSHIILEKLSELVLLVNHERL